MHFVADLHLHSKYSRAVSQRMILPEMAKYASLKGINLLTTSDFTHPLWFKEIKNLLEEAAPGVYKLKSQVAGHKSQNDNLRYILTTEVACIYSQGGIGRRIHALIFASGFAGAEKINQSLLKYGANLHSDGRPILGMSAIDLYRLVLEVDSEAFIIPAHVWTPWFSVYGSKSGFDSLDECFGEFADRIYGIETGLSSDPLMNWQIEELNNRSILSFSDSHSLIKMAREATVFDIPKTIDEVTFADIKEAIKGQGIKGSRSNNVPHPNSFPRGEGDQGRILYTIEFYPEEGKYHYTGHRNCGVVYGPEDTKKNGTVCPVCKRGLTVGVMERVEALKNQEDHAVIKKSLLGIKWITDPKGIHPPFVNLVPLVEVIAEAMDSTVMAQRVLATYENLCLTFGSELDVLLKVPIREIEKSFDPKIAEAVQLVRGGDIAISPGYDGEYGKVNIWEESHESLVVDGQQSGSDPEVKEEKSQLGLDI